MMIGARSLAAMALACLGTGCTVNLGDAASDDAPDEFVIQGTVEPGMPTAADLLAAVATCGQVVGGPFATDSSEPSSVSVCAKTGIVHWAADLDVDCDGLMSSACNKTTDPYFLPDTSAHDSAGMPLDAAALPFVVVPGKSTKFDYRAAGLALGSVFAVIYKDRVEYGVVGDTGPTAIIGEASYAMADALDIDPDPKYGGVESGVTYIGFTGEDAVADPIEDHDLAVSIGVMRARQLLAP